MGYSSDPISANCYSGTTVLINKFDIREEGKLNEVEGVLTSARYAEWLRAPKVETFDFNHYKAIHRFLFSDLYDWAGEVRTVNISKKGTQFAPVAQIESQAMQIFERLKTRNFFKGLSHDVFVGEIVDLYCVTNFLHPFREGNGRTQRLFLTQLIRQCWL
jgi:Protein involved in cell division